LTIAATNRKPGSRYSPAYRPASSFKWTVKQ